MAEWKNIFELGEWDLYVAGGGGYPWTSGDDGSPALFPIGAIPRPNVVSEYAYPRLPVSVDEFGDIFVDTGEYNSEIGPFHICAVPRFDIAATAMASDVVMFSSRGEATIAYGTLLEKSGILATNEEMYIYYQFKPNQFSDAVGNIRVGEVDSNVVVSDNWPLTGRPCLSVHFRPRDPSDPLDPILDQPVVVMR